MEKLADYVFDEKRARKVCVAVLVFASASLAVRLLVTLVWGV